MGIILKDWYGKDHEYDYDRIWIRDTDGGLVPFTKGAGSATLKPLEVTKNGSYTPQTEGVDGFSEVIVNVGQATNEILFNKTDFTGFAANADFNGLYTKALNFGTDIEDLKMILGSQYSISWDDELYTLTVKDTYRIFEELDKGEYLNWDMYYLGNGSLLGYTDLPDTGEPFVIQYTESKGLTLISSDNSEKHNIALMKRVRPQDGVDMMLQSIKITENGEYTAENHYDGFSKVTVEVPAKEVVLQDKEATENGEYTADNGYDGLGKVTVNVPATEIELQEKTVALSMLSGDQIVEADEGRAMYKVTVQKPSTLIPENIAEGVDIAGIVGMLVAGGGTINFKYGSVTGNGGATVINHGLGVTPDIVIVSAPSAAAISAKAISFMTGISSAFATLLGMTKLQFGVGYNGGWMSLSSAYPIENSTVSLLYGANAETITFGNPDGYFARSEATYNWFAISGLTK